MYTHWAVARAMIKLSGHQHRWLAGGYDLEIGLSLEVDSMVVSWCIVAFLSCDICFSHF